MLGLTDCDSGTGRGARWVGLLALSGLVALVWMAGLGGLSQWVTGRAQHVRADAVSLRSVQLATRRTRLGGLDCPLTRSQAAAAHGSLITGRGDVSAEQLHRPLEPARGRTGFWPDLQALQRAVRARHDAIVAAMGQRMRGAALPVAEGHSADRPTIVTRPLRGPPAGG